MSILGLTAAPRNTRLWLVLIVLAYLVLATAYSIVTPLAETPDESEHFRYLQAIAKTGELPIMQPQREANLTLEAHQPPLYYALGAALTAGLDLDPRDNPVDNPCFSFEPDDPGRKTAYLHDRAEWPPQRDLYRAFRLMRLLSVLMGAATIVLAYVIGRQLLPDQPWFGLATAAMLAFNPQFILITGSMNNDVPTTMLGAAIVVLAVSALSRPRSAVYVLLGIAAGLGILTKFALIAFWPLAILAAIWPAAATTSVPLRFRWSGEGLFGRLMAVVGLPLLIAGWWYFRNYQLYGDPLMWDVTMAAKGSVIARTTPFALADLAEFFALHFQSYWLWFGWLNIKAPSWVYGLLLIVILLAVVGLLRLLMQRRLVLYLPALIMNGLAVAAIYASLLQYIQTVNWTGYQGRLAFAAAASIAVFLALGLAALGGKRLALGVGAGFFGLAVAALIFLLWPAYPRPAIYEPDRAWQRVCARFEQGLQLEAMQSDDSVLPGSTLPVIVSGYGLAASAAPQEMRVRLIGAEGQVAGEAATALSWGAGEVLTTSLSLPVAPETIPARAVLEVMLLDQDGRPQTAVSAAERELTVPFPVRSVKIAAPPAAVPQPPFDAGVTFGDELTLLGYDVADEESGPAVTLYWRAESLMTEDYTTFVHIRDSQGRLLAQVDSMPTEGIYPTSIWDVGEIVADRKALQLPDGAGLEDVQVVTGVYLLRTLQRLPAVGPDGRRLDHDEWRLDLITP